MDLSPLMAELAAALDAPHDPLRSAAGVLLERLAVDRVSISSIDRAAGAFEILASAGEPLLVPGTRLPLTTSTHFLDAAEGRTFAAARFDADGAFSRPLDDVVRAAGFVAGCAVGVRRGNEVVGAIALSSRAEDPELPGKVDILEAVGGMVALGLGRRPPGRGPSVLVLHQDPLTAHGLARLLEQGVRARALVPRDLAAAVAAIQAGESPAVLVCDAWLDGVPVDEAVAALRRAGTAAPVLVVAAHDTPQNLEAAIRAGAAAYLARPQAVDALALAVSTLQDGRTLLPERAGVTLDRRDRLTPREREVLVALDEGLRTKQVALRLGLSEDTVKSHTRNVFRKLGASSRAEALHAARRQGLLG